MYAGRQWALIEEHLSDTLGRQAREGGDATTAVRHYMDMLYCPHNNLYCQNLYLQQFMDALQQAQAQLVGAGKAWFERRLWCGQPAVVQWWLCCLPLTPPDPASPPAP